MIALFKFLFGRRPVVAPGCLWSNPGFPARAENDCAHCPWADACLGGYGVDWVTAGRSYAASALKHWPGVTTPHYALSGAFDAMADEIERLRALVRP